MTGLIDSLDSAFPLAEEVGVIISMTCFRALIRCVRKLREFENMQNDAPKDLVREYETPEGGKVREVGPIVYGYSMTIGPDGKPRVKEFGKC